MKMQAVRFRTHAKDFDRMGFALVKEFGLSVLWIVDGDGNKVKTIWDYHLIGGPLCHIDTNYAA